MVCHFVRLFKVDKYSLRKLSPMRSAYACVCRKSFLWSTKCSAPDRYGKQRFLLPGRKWFGVVASKSVETVLSGVVGLAFSVCSTRHIVVDRTSSVTDRLPSTAYIAFLQLLISFSHTPLKWGAAGRLNFHLIPCWTRCSPICSLFYAAIYTLPTLFQLQRNLSRYR